MATIIRVRLLLRIGEERWWSLAAMADLAKGDHLQVSDDITLIITSRTWDMRHDELVLRSNRRFTTGMSLEDLAEWFHDNPEWHHLSHERGSPPGPDYEW